MKLFYLVLLIGAFVRLMIGLTKFAFTQYFVIGMPAPILEVLLMPLYAEVWATGIIFEQIVILNRFGPYARPIVQNASSSGIDQGERFTGILDVVASMAWIVALVFLIFRGQRMLPSQTPNN
mgnify:CR=1 FL=1